MTPDPHPQIPGHPEAGGQLVYDPGCFWCREKTMQPPPTAMPKVVKP